MNVNQINNVDNMLTELENVHSAICLAAIY